MMKQLSASLACLVLTYATHGPYATHAAQVQAAPQPGTFTFRDGRSRVMDLTVADVDGVPGIVWPELVDARYDTALLGVQISADPAAALPSV
jgi:hypothetical protein